jgi:hypothetical protein
MTFENLFECIINDIIVKSYFFFISSNIWERVKQYVAEFIAKIEMEYSN